MKFLIRDDDPCYFTKVEELVECYGKIYTEVPVCFSVTPFRIAGKYFKTELDPTIEMDIQQNPDLVNFIREGVKDNRFDIALHGYNHIYYNDKSKIDRVPEYDVNKGLYEKTRIGKQHLENLFEKQIQTFVPPSNSISKQGYYAVIANGLNLMHIGSFRPSMRPFDTKNILNYFRLYRWRKHQVDMAYPYILKFSKHKELGSYLLYPKTDLQALIDQLKRVHKLNGIFVLATHYHSFAKKMKSGETIDYGLQKVIECANSLGNVQFIKYSELWNH